MSSTMNPMGHCPRWREIVHINGSGEEVGNGGCHGVSVDINLPRPIAIRGRLREELSDVGESDFVMEYFQGIIPTRNQYAVGHVNYLVDTE